MKNTFLSLLMLVALVFAFGAGAPAVKAQSVGDSVSVQAGVLHLDANTSLNEGNVLAGKVEVLKTLGGSKLVFDNTFYVVDNEGSGSGQVVSNQALLRGYVGSNFFLAGGATVGKPFNGGFGSDTFLNPSLQTGVTFDVGSRLQFEPYVQLDTPDLLSDNPARALSANLTTNIKANKSVAFTFDVGITQVRSDNSFLQDGGLNTPYAFGGLKFSF